MVDFAKLKQQSQNSLATLTKQVEKLNSAKKNFAEDDDDDRFWKPTVDKAGNGLAIIRFLPAGNDEDIPFIRMWKHSFKGPGGWYIEDSLTSIGKPDPVFELNGKLWNDGHKAQASAQKRTLTFISNILVIKDPANPANDGQVKLFRYGKQIFDKISAKLAPSEEMLLLDPTLKPIDIFNMWSGADFRMRIVTENNFRNYKNSEFTPQSAISADDAILEGIVNKCHSLQQFLDPKNFKSYDELTKQLHRALKLNSTSSGATTGVQTVPPNSVNYSELSLPFDIDDGIPDFDKQQTSTVASDDDPDLAMFKNLVNKN